MTTSVTRRNVSKHLPDTRSADTTSTSYAKPSRWSTVTEQFQEEWDALKGIAIGTLMGTLRAMIRQHMPSVAPKLEQAINSASTKLGAEPIDFSETQQKTHGHNGHGQSHEPSMTERHSAPRQNPKQQTGKGLRDQHLQAPQKVSIDSPKFREINQCVNPAKPVSDTNPEGGNPGGITVG